MFEAEDDQALADADLGCSQSGTIEGGHRIAHIRDQRLQLRGSKGLYRYGLIE
jgi:hypothetical protein